jgi:predicted RNA-binding Zn ribbon-like protein
VVTEQIEDLPLRGNDLAVNFVNTVTDVRTGNGEYLPRPNDLVRWAHHAGALDAAELEAVLASIGAHPRAAAALHRRALELRAHLSRIFTDRGAIDDVTALDRARAYSANQHVLAAVHDGYALTWRGPRNLDLVTSRVAEAAVALITSERLAKVKQCDGPRCGWLFVDESRTHGRRWCSMQDCGNRAKVRRFRER